ncbi:MAG: M1 family metallopeptidase, partial [Chitinophagaceae bacterium]
MRKFLFLISTNLLLLTANSQYWQQQVNYSIDVSLNDKEHSLNGFEKIEYINNSPDTLRFIWFHLWPNAYKTDKTAYSDQLLENGSTSFYFSGKEEKGYINRLDFKVDNVTASAEDHPEHIDIIKLMLPTPLAPSQKINITTAFHVRLPYNFSRGGHDGESYQATQWYPKPAVYDSKGWHPMPYLDQGEFYSEFGNFDVNITVPSNYVVAATGELMDESEKEWLKTRSSFTWAPVQKKIKTKGGSVKTLVQKFPASSKEVKTLHFKQDRIHDFAWFADKRFIVAMDSCRLPSGRTISVQSYYTSAEKTLWQNSVQYGKRAIQFYSGYIGEYPYNTASVVQGPKSFGGGMEYPTITVISPLKSSAELESVIAHELGHNWFYGILATNERDHPWMDEGINTFYERRYKQLWSIKSNPSDKMLSETFEAEKLDQPISTNSTTFTASNYDLIGYYKTSEWMNWLQSQLGEEAFNKAMKEYYAKWQFKHPQPEDFKKTIEESTGRNLDSAFSLLDKKGMLPNQQSTGFKVNFLLNPRIFNTTAKNVLLISPILGFNSYDQLMVGAVFTNLKLPPSRLQFLVAPLFGTNSKKFAGLGFVNYNFLPDGFFRKIDIGVSAAKFSMDEFKKENGKKDYFGFQK